MVRFCILWLNRFEIEIVTHTWLNNWIFHGRMTGTIELIQPWPSDTKLTFEYSFFMLRKHCKLGYASYRGANKIYNRFAHENSDESHPVSMTVTYIED